ncbi:2-dehydro-3-deoxygalactonokinase [Spirosoma taeanense]|uniref:2-dehydro-3-deoxygalactonokinase n=1 Tax=Spirosoma taeanense TaxID=2735870 RepID=A0A6M5YC70_9BACT|nr:2-dehydro-3-deoxygalactonokinase [Spirosoma taeanense]QJW90883.1 2-dehydro-3-deoxygalactonokinase [Spirosoma taeanense]
MTNYLLCCDWGTSLFRLQLLKLSDYQCVGEVFSPEGIADTFDAWQKTGETKGIAKKHFFRQQLKRQIDVLARKLSISLANIPVVISGMASSSIGMDEVPYATLPFAVNGSQSSVRHFEPQPDFPHEIMLISGVRSEKDVMRGEETQLIGLVTLFGLSGDGNREAIFIFPGTHSKHIYMQEGRLISFSTYMTGELFALMASHSILKDSVDRTHLTDFSEGNVRAFRLGVHQSVSTGILNGLFTIRTNQLFGKFTKTENAFFLSGLLIGSELNHLLAEERWPLVLCSGSRLAAFYKLAIDELKLSARTTFVPAELIDKAAGVGQVILFQNQALKVTAR